MSECKPTEVDRLAQIIRTADGNHDMGAGALAERDNRVRADERAKLQDRIEELEKNLSYEVEQKIKLADTLRDERAKRPDRRQIARALFEADGRRNYDGSPTPWHILDLDEQAHYRKLADAVLSSLALEPEAREETVRVARVVHALAMDCVDE